jgi:hypothetical protein
LQLITNGPDIPNELLQIQEEGNLVIFCGAGISKRVGLPLFAGLVDDIYKNLNLVMTPDEQEAYDQNQYDRVLYLLEEIRRERTRVRKEVRNILDIKQGSPLTTYRNLITLGTNRRGKIRLVTSNFDNGFGLVNNEDHLIDVAPKLPIPRKSRWNSIVHLHGHISKSNDSDDSLVLNSADFGTAYLMDRWASRFVSELFRHFTVLFIGYSLSDTVMRYMMDAFTAERSRSTGEVKDAYVIAAEEEADAERKWRSKGVIPILYKYTNTHVYLHRTLKAWAEIHREGLHGKASIVQKVAPKQPTYIGDEMVEQLIWALTDETGHSSHVFATLDPPPTLDWLPILDGKDLFKYRSENEVLADKVPVADPGYITACPPELGRIPSNLSLWLTKYLTSKQLIHWVISKGGCLHPRFRLLINMELDKGGYSIPIRTLWRFWASSRNGCRCPRGGFDRRLVLSEVKDTWNPDLKHRLLNLLEPFLEFKKPWILAEWMDEDDQATDQEPKEETIREYVDVELHIRGGDPQYVFSKVADWPKTALEAIADGGTSNLLKGWELLHHFEQVETNADLSYISLPSISPHGQNKGYHDWANLVEIIRDSWIELLSYSPFAANRILTRWMQIEYPLFKRLAYFGLANSDFHSHADKLEYLLGDDGWWFWSVEVQRERYRLLDHLTKYMQTADMDWLAAVIIAGPPRKMFVETLEDQEWGRIQDLSIWQIVAKLSDFGWELPVEVLTRFQQICSKHPEWALAEDERDEFPSWSYDSYDYPGKYSFESFIGLSHDELDKLMKKDHPSRENYWSSWQAYVNKYPIESIEYLMTNPLDEDWIQKVWQNALAGFSGPEMLNDSFNSLGDRLLQIDKTIMKNLAGYVLWWLEEVSKSIKDGLPLFWRIWRKMSTFIVGPDLTDLSDPVGKALNNPAGRITDILLRDIWALELNIGETFPNQIKKRLDRVVTSRNLVLSRIILFSRLINLYKIDPTWVNEKMVPLLNPDESAESFALWRGFLWVPNLSPALVQDIKPAFIKTILNRQKLNDDRERIVELFTILVLEQPDSFTSNEKNDIISSFDTSAIARLASTILYQMSSLGERAEVYWEDRVKGLINGYWPRNKDLTNVDISASLAEIAIRAGKHYASAIESVLGYLVPVQFLGHVTYALNKENTLEYNNVVHHPKSTLKLLATLIRHEITVESQDIREILDRIVSNHPKLRRDGFYVQIDEFLLKNNR